MKKAVKAWAVYTKGGEFMRAFSKRDQAWTWMNGSETAVHVLITPINAKRKSTSTK